MGLQEPLRWGMGRVAVLGASGTLGRALAEVLGNSGKYHTRKVWDLRKLEGLEDFLFAFLEDVDAVINAAAYTNVNRAEEEREEAFVLNALFPEVLARVSRSLGLKMVHVSTDYVFDGRVGFYREDDEPSPLSVYGRTKLEGERRVLGVYPDALVVRTSWLFGLGGKNFFSRLPFMLKRGEDIYAHSHQLSCPTYAPRLAGVLIGMLRAGLEGGIYHITGKTPTTPYDFALTVSALLHPTSRVVHFLPDMSIRPRVSVLLSNRYDYPAFPLFEDFSRYYARSVAGL